MGLVEVALMVAIMGGGIPALIILASGITKALSTGRGLTEEDTAALRRELAEASQRLEAAEQRLAESDARLVELEERVDFAERMLARPPERGQLEPGA